jgi:hypothetical protein
LVDTIEEYSQRILREKKAFDSSEDSSADFDDSDDDEDSDDTEAAIAFIKDIKAGLTPEEWHSVKGQIIETYAEGLDPELLEE